LEVLKLLLYVLLVTGCCCLCIFSHNKDLVFNQELTEYGFKLPVFAPLGILLVGKVPHNFDDRKTKVKLIQLFGHHKAAQFYKIHLIQK
jgi:hypothetical protein